MTPYKTLLKAGEGRYEEKKSVFYGFAFPIVSEKEAIETIAELRSRYPDARHHCYAYLLREGNLTRYSDDREPQGTAGLPMLDLLRKAELCDTLLVVVRYFGGTLLGTGGLVRAYTASAKEAITDAGMAMSRPARRFSLSLSYADYEKTALLLEKRGAEILTTDYDSRVLLSCRCPSDGFSDLSQAVTELLNGRSLPEAEGEEFILIPIADAG